MPSLPNKDDGFRPHKRTGVWSLETTKQTSAIPEKVLQQSFKDSTEMSNENEDECSNFSSKTNFNDIVKNRMKSKLFKLPALNSWNDINMGLLLNQFNDEEDVKDEDIAWTHDYLFAEITNKLRK